HGELRELIRGNDDKAQSEPRPPPPGVSHASVARASCEGARLAGAEEIRDTAPAKARVHRVAPDIGAVVPAPLALALRAPRHMYQALGPLRDARGGSDEHESKIVTQARQRLVLPGWRDDIGFGLERRSDLARLARFFEFLQQLCPVRADDVPFRHKLRRESEVRDCLAPGLNENARIVLVDGAPGLLRGEA